MKSGKFDQPSEQPVARAGSVRAGGSSVAEQDQVIVDGRVPIDAGQYVHGDETAMISAATGAIGKNLDLPEAQAAFND